MYYFYAPPYFYYTNVPIYHYERQLMTGKNINEFDFLQLRKERDEFRVKDYGPEPFVVTIDEATKGNNTFRSALWTGNHLQVTLMSIPIGEDIGLEIHPDVDQFLRIEQGQGLVRIGENKNHLNFQRRVHDDDAIMIPASTWHNVINTGDVPLKLYSIYAPSHHPHGTVHVTKADAMEYE